MKKFYDSDLASVSKSLAVGGLAQPVIRVMAGLLLVLLMAVSHQARAQRIIDIRESGDGGFSSWPWPFWFTSFDLRTATIYSTAEVGQAGYIYALRWNTVSHLGDGGATQPWRGYSMPINIYLKLVPNETFIPSQPAGS
jgi:hypothetical protein